MSLISRTAPPRESIGGTKPRQISAMADGIDYYNKLVLMEEMIESSDYQDFPQEEKDWIEAESEALLLAYAKNQDRVNTY